MQDDDDNRGSTPSFIDRYSQDLDGQKTAPKSSTPPSLYWALAVFIAVAVPSAVYFNVVVPARLRTKVENTATIAGRDLGQYVGTNKLVRFEVTAQPANSNSPYAYTRLEYYQYKTPYSKGISGWRQIPAPAPSMVTLKSAGFEKLIKIYDFNVSRNYLDLYYRGPGKQADRAPMPAQDKALLRKSGSMCQVLGIPSNRRLIAVGILEPNGGDVELVPYRLENDTELPIITSLDAAKLDFYLSINETNIRHMPELIHEGKMPEVPID